MKINQIIIYLKSIKFKLLNNDFKVIFLDKFKFIKESKDNLDEAKSKCLFIYVP